jgi:endonuclease/exonuclease/phosphatase family metal-dependent hydrolase
VKAAAFSLVLLTLNVAGPRRVHQGWPTREAAIEEGLRAEKPGAVALQEVWRETDLDDLAGAAGLSGRAFDADLGLAVLSRLPVESSASLDLGGGYGALRARVKAGRQGADLYSARLEPGDGEAAARRLAQVFRLSEFVRAQSAGRPFALMGDLAASPDDHETQLLLDLLEARDLCVSHGDEMCGRTLGDRRVDFVLIPYASRPPREAARAAFTSLLPDDGDAPEPRLHFGLRAELGPRFLRLKPAARPSGRSEALSSLEDELESARDAVARLRPELGWIPFLGTERVLASAREEAGLDAALEEVRTAEIRDARARVLARRRP